MRRGSLPDVRIRILLVVVLSVVAVGCYGGDGYNDYTKGPSAPGGATSVAEYGPGAFSHPAANLSDLEEARFRIGDTFFTEPWTSAPGSNPERDGLGPTYLATSCAACHPADGRSAAPGTAGDDGSPILRFVDSEGVATNQDAYHFQLQTVAVDGVEPEATLDIVWEVIEGQYPDGTPYSLRRPVVSVTGESFGSLSDATATGLRVGPALIGLGLLEAIPEADIRAGADPEDSNGDGISGRISTVDSELSGADALGRFGLKANVATVAEQTAIAYLLDLGITTPLHPEENCPPAQAACAGAASGGSPEISEDRFDDVVFYTQTLAVPSRAFAEDESVIEGEALFDELGCSLCHVRRWETGDHQIEAVSNQTIYPYTDLLLHDMGPELSDGRADGVATATEWKTPALWGLGLTRSVNAAAGFLHDGRARSIEEAILWHGGEASESRGGFVALSEGDRDLLLIFLKSL